MAAPTCSSKSGKGKGGKGKGGSSKGEYCDDNTEMCIPRKSLGSECDGSDECESDYCRDDGTMTGTRRCQERTQCG